MLTFQPQDLESRLHYEQKTWRVVDGAEVILHWECGFIRQLTDQEYEWINAQNNGRVEVMKGTIRADETSLTLEFVTVTFANDPRMTAAKRVLTVSGDTLHYEQQFATHAHPTIHPHLQADLKRTHLTTD